MKRKLLWTAVLLMTCYTSLHAAHIRGGELSYKFISAGTTPNTSIYEITLKLYIDCNQNAPGQLETEVPITIFRSATNTEDRTLVAPMSFENFIRYDPNSNPCISNAPTDVCYRLRYFTTRVTLANIPGGYTLAWQRCCRINGIRNVSAPSESYGVTCVANIPGTNIDGVPDAYKNSSPQFDPRDAVAICYGSYFTFDFSAIDSDTNSVGKLSDSLVYSLCEAYNGGGQGNSWPNVPNPNPANNPPYYPISYSGSYSGSSPMGPNATIDPKTGILSGIAPSVEGQYVVKACVSEYRNNVLINVHHKEIHLRVSDCIPLRARLKPDYSYCDDFNVTFRNEQVNPAGTMYIWDYGDGSKRDTVFAADGMVRHLYNAPNDYTIKLKVVLAGQCFDSTTTIAKVWPGFKPAFTWRGSCILNPIQFEDRTTTVYGSVSKWQWDFGDETSSSDASTQKNPAWRYSTTGFKSVRLIVESDKGCIDTLVQSNVEIKDKPTITLAFRDTLICSNRPVQDTLQLQASGFGVFSWTPTTDLLFPNSGTPLVFPDKTTIYRVSLNENGCINTDSVKVRTISFVTLDAGPDTTICLTDTIQLRPRSDGLRYTWTSTPASPIDDANARNPLVNPTGNTSYEVFAEVGKCNTTDNLRVTTIPYPTSIAGPDTTICYADTIRLHGSMIGARLNWLPMNTLSNPFILSPFAWPLRTTTYILRVTDTIGCPKPKFDSVTVTVRSQIHAFAGNDTSIVINQPLRLSGSGAEFIEWWPSNFLSTTRGSNPVALLSDHYTYYMRAYTAEGCYADDTINVKVFKTKPDVFVPNAFRPGGTQNNLLRPILAGISKLSYFQVYNRWGQLVFQTSQPGAGWDGRIGGKLQDPGTFVWMVKAEDFLGQWIIKKGTAVLIR
ncbi:PKD domain-containing protein [Pseudoflavitalea rhizosphaerae]|uniref:PKD domain-containing protein n=1 Tax=Pseudoflavitalea rhizosphaerae TaxID=1884793 RepID=UPI000F8D0B58|nr:PKD domain-containing protein [Pseudoflavitalea rhizosphaerae]